jgi:hypothetical protein
MSGIALQQRKRCAVSLVVVAVVCAITHARDAAALEYVMEKVALEGDPAPRGDGTYRVFLPVTGSASTIPAQSASARDWKGDQLIRARM